MKQTIYIDCTHTYFSGLNTGIQRVVRKVITNLSFLDIKENISVIPVVYNKRSYVSIDKLPIISSTQNKINVKNLLKKIYVKIRDILKFIPFFQKVLYSPFVVTYLNKIFDVLTLKNKEIISQKVVVLKKNDILLMLDSTWLDTDFEHLKQLKQNDIRIISVVYDLIPVLHPIYCGDDLSKVFELWLRRIVPIVDGFITISKTVEKQLNNYLNSNYLNKTLLKTDYFLLGVDFQKSKVNPENIDYKLKSVLSPQSTYITVSTLEPRKNHNYVLDTFDKLWEMGLDVNYVIIGRIGWKVDKLIERIKNHKYFNKRLFLFNNVDDNALMYSYENSKAMIFASYAEGFGLPIIESLYYNLQVLASSIPIHKEVGKNNITYFDIDNVNSLVTLIQEDNYQKEISQFSWKTWNESTKELLNKTLNMVENYEK
jgi:O-antigen biosynthesis alpha-1,2-rhamnosyltransferase